MLATGGHRWITSKRPTMTFSHQPMLFSRFIDNIFPGLAINIHFQDGHKMPSSPHLRVIQHLKKHIVNIEGMLLLDPISSDAKCLQVQTTIEINGLCVSFA